MVQPKEFTDYKNSRQYHSKSHFTFIKIEIIQPRQIKFYSLYCKNKAQNYLSLL